jgi:hypothetical protein
VALSLESTTLDGLVRRENTALAAFAADDDAVVNTDACEDEEALEEDEDDEEPRVRVRTRLRPSDVGM